MSDVSDVSDGSDGSDGSDKEGGQYMPKKCPVYSKILLEHIVNIFSEEHLPPIFSLAFRMQKNIEFNDRLLDTRPELDASIEKQVERVQPEDRVCYLVFCRRFYGLPDLKCAGKIVLFGLFVSLCLGKNVWHG